MGQKINNPYLVFDYIPDWAKPIIEKWIHQNEVIIKIKKPRSTKLGDYAHPRKNNPLHIITINKNLNQYEFLIVLIHEFAHLYTWKNYGNKVKSHGIEWKIQFTDRLNEFLNLKLFPEDIEIALQQTICRPTASTCTDVNLHKVLKKYDWDRKKMMVENVFEGALFMFSDKRIFRKGKVIRKRIKCMELKTKKEYLFSPIAEVEAIPMQMKLF